MNKRGEPLLMQSLVTWTIVGILIVSFLFLLNNSSRDPYNKKQIVAKQLCIIMTSAENNTVINVTSNLIIEKQNKSIVAKLYPQDPGYSYPCYANNFTVTNENGVATIKIIS